MQYDRFANFQAVEPGARIVSMVPYQDMILIATQSNIYTIKGGVISLAEFNMPCIAESIKDDEKTRAHSEDDLLADRYNYFRAHEHPFGWGVNDFKTGACVALCHDKGLAAYVADALNSQKSLPDLGDPGRDAYLADFSKNWDAYHSHSPSACVYRYNYDTGGLEPFHIATGAKK